MGKTKTWKVNVEDQVNIIKIEFHTFSGNHKLIVNGVSKGLRLTFKSKITGLDQALDISGKNVRLVVRGNKADLAVDGFYLDSKKEYVPLQDMPNWAWLFIIACVAIPFFTLGGAIPAVIGISGAMLCAKASTLPSYNTFTKFLFLLLITAASWIIMLVFIDFMLSL